jgi:hypothetical protein
MGHLGPRRKCVRVRLTTAKLANLPIAIAGRFWPKAGRFPAASSAPQRPEEEEERHPSLSILSLRMTGGAS